MGKDTRGNDIEEVTMLRKEMENFVWSSQSQRQALYETPAPYLFSTC
jgi:hypothetical protein